MKKIFNFILIILFLILEIYLLSNSKIIINDFNKSLNICIYTLMPTMFASILFSQILIGLNFEKYIPKFIINIFGKIFNISDKEVVIFILSLISGYPNNSKMLKNNLNLNNIILYTNFVNPIFLICTVGSIYLKNLKLTLIILMSHYISNIIIGILIRNKNIYLNERNINANENSFFNIYFSSLNNTVRALVNIFSNILFFSILISLLNNILPFNDIINSFIIGLFEFSNGIFLISNTSSSIFIKGLLITCIITFSSFSIHMQILSINEKIKYINYLFYRIINVLISSTIYILLYYFL